MRVFKNLHRKFIVRIVIPQSFMFKDKKSSFLLIKLAFSSSGRPDSAAGMDSEDPFAGNGMNDVYEEAFSR